MSGDPRDAAPSPREPGRVGNAPPEAAQVGIPIALGIALGAGIGAALGNVAIGIAVGLALGGVIGGARSRRGP